MFSNNTTTITTTTTTMKCQYSSVHHTLHLLHHNNQSNNKYNEILFIIIYVTAYILLLLHYINPVVEMDARDYRSIIRYETPYSPPLSAKMELIMVGKYYTLLYTVLDKRIHLL